jgi:hypothetical protein
VSYQRFTFEETLDCRAEPPVGAPDGASVPATCCGVSREERATCAPAGTDECARFKKATVQRGALLGHLRTGRPSRGAKPRRRAGGGAGGAENAARRAC